MIDEYICNLQITLKQEIYIMYLESAELSKNAYLSSENVVIYQKNVRF